MTQATSLEGLRLGPFIVTSRLSGAANESRFLARKDEQAGVFVVSPLGSVRERPSSYWTELVQEVAQAKKLTHPNILPVVDLGELEGKRYLVAEYENGVRFEALIERLIRERDRLPLSEVVSLGRTLTDALASLEPSNGQDPTHALVHGRITPENLLLSERGVPKLGGFADPSSGNLAYQAPEQLLGLPPDGRADVFALGVVLLELLVGHRVFHRPDPAGTIGAVLGGEPLPSLEVIGPELRPRVGQIFERALARDRDQRYPSARAFHAELTDLASQLERSVPPSRHLETSAAEPSPKTTTSADLPLLTPTEAPAAPLAPPETKPSARRGARVALLIALAGLLVGGLVFLGSRFVVPPEMAPPVAAEVEPPPAKDALSRAHRAAGMRALESANYPLAVSEFQAALAAPHPSHDLDRLLSIAQTLRARAEAPLAEAPPSEPEAPAPPEVEEAPTGLLLVTTDPPGLLIYIDGAVKDMSPARLELSPGRHRLTIRRGKRRLVDQRVFVKKEAVVPVDLDLAEQVAALEAPPPPREERPSESEPAGSSAEAPTPPIASADLEPEDAVPPAPEAAATNLARGAETPSPARDETPPTEPIAAAPAIPPPAPEPPRAVPSKAVRQTMGTSSKEFRECYYRQLLRDEGARGSVLLTMMVQPDGRVSSVSMKSAFASSRMKRCLRREIQRLRFPEHAHSFPIPARFRLVFQPTS